MFYALVSVLLCENGAENSLNIFFDNWTNHHFIERRITYGKIEHLLEDVRLAVDHPSLKEVKKQ